MLPKFDLHLHTRYSDGTAEHAAMVEAANARGLEAIAFTDHGPGIPIGVKREKLPQMLRDMEVVRDDSNVPVLASIEANVVDGEGNIDIDDEFIEKLDILSVGIHFLGTENPVEIGWDYLSRARKVIERHSVDIFCHPLYYDSDLTLSLPWEEVEEFIKLAATRGVAMEVNVKYRSPNGEFLRSCIREGVKLSIGSDAHRPSEVGKIDWALSALKRAGAEWEDMVLDSLLK